MKNEMVCGEIMLFSLKCYVCERKSNRIHIACNVRKRIGHAMQTFLRSEWLLLLSKNIV